MAHSTDKCYIMLMAYLIGCNVMCINCRQKLSPTCSD